MQPILDRLRQRMRALTLPNWAWTGSAKGMVYAELEQAVETIERLSVDLAGSSDAALAVWNRALKAEQDNEALRLEVARLTIRIANELGTAAAGHAADVGRNDKRPNLGKPEVRNAGALPGAGRAVRAESAA